MQQLLVRGAVRQQQPVLVSYCHAPYQPRAGDVRLDNLAGRKKNSDATTLENIQRAALAAHRDMVCQLSLKHAVEVLAGSYSHEAVSIGQISKHTNLIAVLEVQTLRHQETVYKYIDRFISKINFRGASESV